jgi:hypothetical protein
MPDTAQLDRPDDEAPKGGEELASRLRDVHAAATDLVEVTAPGYRFGAGEDGEVGEPGGPAEARESNGAGGPGAAGEPGGPGGPGEPGGAGGEALAWRCPSGHSFIVATDAEVNVCTVCGEPVELVKLVWSPAPKDTVLVGGSGVGR